MAAAFEHFIENAEARYLASFDSWFPGCFDYERLCADVPDLALRSGRALPEAPGETAERLLEEQARGVFRTAHLYTLAALCAGADIDEGDPDEILDGLTSSTMDDEEEEKFTELVLGSLTHVEEALEGEHTVEEDEARAVGYVGAAWPILQDLLRGDDGGPFAHAGACEDLLWGVARVGAVLAAFRWIAAGVTTLD
ncbi:MAG: hypothetical protein ACYTG6_02855 [Planctomycetota bacterium]|jgi:hypothetical protein